MCFIAVGTNPMTVAPAFVAKIPMSPVQVVGLQEVRRFSMHPFWNNMRLLGVCEPLPALPLLMGRMFQPIGWNVLLGICRQPW